jgi:hypothetical protein
MHIKLLLKPSNNTLAETACLGEHFAQSSHTVLEAVQWESFKILKVKSLNFIIKKNVSVTLSFWHFLYLFNVCLSSK